MSHHCVCNWTLKLWQNGPFLCTHTKFTARLSHAVILVSLSLPRDERMRLILSAQMVVVWLVCVCVCVRAHIYGCAWGVTCIVCLFYSVSQDAWLKIKSRLFRLQCKSAHCDRVRKARVEILWQVLLFDSWLPMAAAASPCSLGPQPWTAHGVCLTCGLCCCSNQSLHGHSYMWLAVADSWSRYSSFFFSLCLSVW